MKPYEFMRLYNPKLGKFIYKHKGSGIIVDNIMKPMRKIVSPIVKKFVVKKGKKALKSGVSNLSKKTPEKSGDMIMKKLDDARQKTLPPPIKQQEESIDMMINRLISGSGVRRKKVKFM